MHDRVGLGGPSIGRHRSGETEVENLDLPVFQEEHVLQFQIAVDDPFLVRRGQSAGNLHRDLERLLDRQRALLKFIAHGPAIEQLGDDVDLTAAGARVMNRENVWMRERGDRFSLLLEPRAPIRIGGKRRWQDFDRRRRGRGACPRRDRPHPYRPHRVGRGFVRAEAMTGLSAIGYFRDGRAAAGRGSGRAAACVRPKSRVRIRCCLRPSQWLFTSATFGDAPLFRSQEAALGHRDLASRPAVRTHQQNSVWEILDQPVRVRDRDHFIKNASDSILRLLRGALQQSRPAETNLWQVTVNRAEESSRCMRTI